MSSSFYFIFLWEEEVDENNETNCLYIGKKIM